MEYKQVTSGSVSLQGKTFYYEFWSDNSDVMVKIFHKGKKGDFTEFPRGRHPIKEEMEGALKKAKVL